PAKARNSFYLQLGIASLVAPDNFLFGYSSGVQFEVGYGFGISPSFSILVDTQYCSFPMIPSYYPGIYGPGNQTAYVTGGGIQIISFLGNAKFNFVASNNPVVFYGIAGLGPEVFLEDAKYSTSVSATAPAYSEVDLALRLAIGIDIKLSPGLALAIENNSIETFVSQTLSNTGTFSRDNFSIGLKMDN
ncbi:MAG TPA: outer membrane beta-barrel protein, partial [bacterium]